MASTAAVVAFVRTNPALSAQYDNLSTFVTKSPALNSFLTQVGGAVEADPVILFVMILSFLVVIATGLLLAPSEDGQPIPLPRVEGPRALNKDNWTPFKLVKKDQLTHDTVLLRFALQSPKHVLGLPIGQHISWRFVQKGENGEEDKEIMRSYTPTSGDRHVGYVEFVIKMYLAPTFKVPGAMSTYVDNLKVGDSVEMRGPKGKITYLGGGHFDILEKGVTLHRKSKHIGMVAGGSGITPMLQILQAICDNPHDKTKVSLLFANKSEQDILVREHLDACVAKKPEQIKVWYTLDSAPANWKYSTGFVSAEMLSQPGCGFPAPVTDAKEGEWSSLLFVCGPPPMIKFACTPSFQKLGFTVEKDMISF